MRRFGNINNVVRISEKKDNQRRSVAAQTAGGQGTVQGVWPCVAVCVLCHRPWRQPCVTDHDVSLGSRPRRQPWVTGPDVSLGSAWATSPWWACWWQRVVAQAALALGGSNWVLGFWSRCDPILAVTSIWGMNQHMENCHLQSSLIFR